MVILCEHGLATMKVVETGDDDDDEEREGKEEI